MALTEQKRRYALARVAGLPKKRAAMAAGCPEKTAAQAASRYEKDPDVQKAMERKHEAMEAAQMPDPDKTEIPPRAADDPLEFMRQMMRDIEMDPKLRLDAAKALAGFTLAKPGEKGKKEQDQDRADKVLSKGRFTASPSPRLVVSNGARRE